ncbi:hypothetical protein SGCZBJ_03780 [Caulobacter zeae]|uniref:Uncharacterized protein n=1 Tax=Caulobacter zeae TaxID=2055137 RepID=A0A2N5DQ02_9CAUL|nr:hypothetical protein [Caulobacter zeae]PLR28138.1 hypothetical protein SGCZBJ_03780 [Caulobacter zeae]
MLILAIVAAAVTAALLWLANKVHYDNALKVGQSFEAHVIDRAKAWGLRALAAITFTVAGVSALYAWDAETTSSAFSFIGSVIQRIKA